MSHVSLDWLISVLTLLVALSMSTERIVELVKSTLPWLKEGDPRALPENGRRLAVHALAVVAGIGAAFLGAPAIPDTLFPKPIDPRLLVALGLMASGGSSFWNSALGLAEGIRKERKEIAAAMKEAGTAGASASARR